MLLEVSQPSEVADQRSEATADISFRECIWKTFETVHLYFFLLFFFFRVINFLNTELHISTHQ